MYAEVKMGLKKTDILKILSSGCEIFKKLQKMFLISDNVERRKVPYLYRKIKNKIFLLHVTWKSTVRKPALRLSKQCEPDLLNSHLSYIFPAVASQSWVPDCT